MPEKGHAKGGAVWRGPGRARDYEEESIAGGVSPHAARADGLCVFGAGVRHFDAERGVSVLVSGAHQMS